MAQVFNVRLNPAPNPCPQKLSRKKKAQQAGPKAVVKPRDSSNMSSTLEILAFFPRLSYP